LLESEDEWEINAGAGPAELGWLYGSWTGRGGGMIEGAYGIGVT
jgi:hypothetical protein